MLNLNKLCILIAVLVITGCNYNKNFANKPYEGEYFSISPAENTWLIAEQTPSSIKYMLPQNEYQCPNCQDSNSKHRAIYAMAAVQFKEDKQNGSFAGKTINEINDEIESALKERKDISKYQVSINNIKGFECLNYSYYEKIGKPKFGNPTLPHVDFAIAYDNYVCPCVVNNQPAIFSITFSQKFAERKNMLDLHMERQKFVESFKPKF
jgi:hypothetical protein